MWSTASTWPRCAQLLNLDCFCHVTFALQLSTRTPALVLCRYCHVRLASLGSTSTCDCTDRSPSHGPAVQPKPRDGVSRPPVIPPGVAEARARRDAGDKRKTEKDLQEEQGGAGVYNSDVRKLYDLKDPAWRYDIMPEIMNGKNVSRKRGRAWRTPRKACAVRGWKGSKAQCPRS